MKDVLWTLKTPWCPKGKGPTPVLDAPGSNNV